MPDDLEIRVFQLSAEQDFIFDFLLGCDRGDDEEGFAVTDMRNVHYFEFAKLPDYEPTLRVRVAGQQLWVENREDLPDFIHDDLKYEFMPHIVYKPSRMLLSVFSGRNPQPVDIKDLSVEANYQV